MFIKYSLKDTISETMRIVAQIDLLANIKVKDFPENTNAI